jgi:uncharacterized protein
MRHTIKAALLGGVISALAFVPAQAQTKFVTIASGPVGGAWYMLGGALVNMLTGSVPDTKFAVTTGGALGNISMVQSGKAEVGITMDNLLHEAHQGAAAFKDKGSHEQVQGLALLGDIHMSLFLVVPDSPLKSIDEIKAKRVAIRLLTAPKASSPSAAAERMLAEYGITFADIESWGGRTSFVSYAEAGSLIRDGHADAWVGPMTPPIVEVSTRKNMRHLPIRPELLEVLKAKYKYGSAVIPKGYYPFVAADTPTMTEPMMLVIRKDVPDNVVQAFAKTLSANADAIRKVHRFFENFDPAKMCQFSGGPMHPGALKAFKEQGICK